MITSSLSKKEVNHEIIQVLPGLMRMVNSKTIYRAKKGRKKGFKDEVSSYEIKGVKFWVYYFIDLGEDVSRIFCPYPDRKGSSYAMLNVPGPGKYAIIHFLQHAINRYNSRLNLGYSKDDVKSILFHMAKYGVTMNRQELDTSDENWIEVGWKGENGLWLGKCENEISDNPLYVSLAKTFINDKQIRKDQEGVLDDEKLEMLAALKKEIGDDEYASRRISQLINLYKLN